MLLAPVVSVLVVIDHWPDPLAVPVPTTVPLERISAVVFACDVPENVGVRSSVLLSVLEEPVSDDATRSGTDGTFGLVASIVTDSALDSALVFCPLVARAVKLYVPSTSAGLTV